MNRFFLLVVLLCLINFNLCQLVVNIKNNGGDVYRENIDANTTQDTVSLEFRKADGTLVTQFIDARNEIEIFKVVILPEEERGHTQVQTICFVSRFAKHEFISSDAMSKLRQKNPSAVRHPEEIRPAEFLHMDLVLNVANAHVLSPHITTLCSGAVDMAYVSDNDLRLLSQILSRDYQTLLSISQSMSMNGTALCQVVLDPAQPCTCRYDLCVGWYPCGLKYCRGKDSTNHMVNYRCGIKTCSKCRNFSFLVKRKALCSWDEPEFSLEPEAALTTELGKQSFSPERNVVPLPDVLKQGPDQTHLQQNMPVASTNQQSDLNGKSPVNMEQRGIAMEAKKATVMPPLGSNGKGSIAGKSERLDDDEDGE